MNNRDWLFSLPLDEQYAWMNAEHQDGTLDGDTAAQDGDSRDKLEADVRKIAEAYNMDTQRHGTERFEHELYHSIMHLLDRQAAITERECRKPNWDYCETCETLAELTAERDKLQEQLRIGWECECRLQAERDELQAKVDELIAECDSKGQTEPYLFGMPLDEVLGKLKQVDELASQGMKMSTELANMQERIIKLKDERDKAREESVELYSDLVKASDEREHYREKCSKMATIIHDALMVMDEGMV